MDSNNVMSHSQPSVDLVMHDVGVQTDSQQPITYEGAISAVCCSRLMTLSEVYFAF